MAWVPCPQGHGDYNRDGIIDDRDWDILQSCYGKFVSEHPECALCDLTGPKGVPNGLIDIVDYTTFAVIWGGHCPICNVDLVEYVPPWVSLLRGLAALGAAGVIMGATAHMVKKAFKRK